jgi:zinc transport system ATP-binding protein
MSAQEIIRIENVSFSYGGPKVLENVNLSIKENEFIGIVGPNGGGKTTLLKIILGILEPDYGKITIFGDSTENSRSEIGYMPQIAKFNRDFPITVEETVLLGRLGRTSKFGFYNKKDKAIAKKAMEDVEVLEFKDRTIGSLSGGQLQRVLVARALACEPKILILDEPTANVDLRIEKDIFELLKILNERIAILVVSHDIGFISEYIHRAACLNRTLITHQVSSLDGEAIQDLYGKHVKMIAHDHGHGHH